MQPGHIQIVETLTLHKQYRLIEIAHETSDYELKKLALGLLQRYLHPPIFVGGEERDK